MRVERPHRTSLKQQKKNDPRRATKRDGAAAWAGLQPGKPALAPSSSKRDGSRPTRERGRPARMHSRCVPLSFPAMAHPATLPARTAWARPKQSPGVSAGRAGSSRWATLRQELCGRDARAPGWASSRDVVAAKEIPQQPPMRIILCILCIRVQSRILLDGSAPSRAVSMGAGLP